MIADLLGQLTPRALRAFLPTVDRPRDLGQPAGVGPAVTTALPSTFEQGRQV